MSEVVQDSPQEFWQPPSPVVANEVVLRDAVLTLAEVCPRCRTEFLLGSGFCHSCGGRRPEANRAVAKGDVGTWVGLWAQGLDRVSSLAAEFSWSKIQFPSWLHYLHFHEIKNWIGLTTAPLVAFVIGIGCVAGALLVGLLTARNFVDWQAIQFYRAEWLLAATACFVAGILLKKSSSRDRD
jgi:hypothetical protein